MKRIFNDLIHFWEDNGVNIDADECWGFYGDECECYVTKGILQIGDLGYFQTEYSDVEEYSYYDYCDIFIR